MAERLAKYLATHNICSRRCAEEMIVAGRVSVNGVVVTTPITFVDDHDDVCVNGRKILTREPARLWVYSKPRGEITTHRDPAGRRTVFEAVQSLGLPRVISVGRLDLNSEGLLLLTTHSTLAHMLESPHNILPRVYRVRLFGQMALRTLKPYQASPRDPTFFKMPSQTLESIHYAPWTLKLDTIPTQDQLRSTHNFWATVTLTEGKNREIRKLMKALGFQVNRLIRQRYGPFQLGSLPSGKVREITTWRTDLIDAGFTLPEEL